MLVGVIADTHDHLTRIDQAVERLNVERVDVVIHAGDVVAPFAARRLLACAAPLHIIYGNNDGERAGLRAVLPQIHEGPLHLELAGCRIVVGHFIDWITAAEREDQDVIITGHTHDVGTVSSNGQLLLNPGECCGWVTGRATIALLDTTTRSVRIIDL